MNIREPGAWVRRFDLPAGAGQHFPPDTGHLVRARLLSRNSRREGLEWTFPQLAPIGGRMSCLGRENSIGA